MRALVREASVRRVPAVDRAARALQALERSTQPLSMSELARALGINKGSMRDVLETLRAHGLVDRDEERKQYRLGPGLARLGMTALGQLELPRVAHPFLLDLAHQVGLAVLLLLRQSDRALIVDKADAGGVAVQVSATVGRRIPLAAGACGKVFFAFGRVDAGEWRRHLAALPHPTPSTMGDPQVYAAELEHVRQNGYATDDEEYLAGVRATAAPVFDARGRLAACVLVVGLSGALRVEDLPRLGEATAATAAAISAALGAPPGD